MKRYNIHFDGEWMKALDEIRLALIKETKDNWRIRDLTRADLVRHAVGQQYGLGKRVLHCYGLDLEKLIKKVVKRRTTAKNIKSFT